MVLASSSVVHDDPNWVAAPTETPARRRCMPNLTRSRSHGFPKRGEATTTIFVARASLSGFPEGAKAKTLLRSIGVLEGWLEQNEASAGKVRVRRIKRWRGEALQQLRLELNLTSSP